ncbi:MAG: C40 family peptidase [Lachnospiraceae bacterium]
MKRRLVRALIASVVMSSLMITTVSATPSVDELKDKKAAAENEVSDLQTKLNTLMTKMNELQNQLISTGEKLIQAEEDLAVAEEKKQNQYEDMKLRIKYMYEEGNGSALEKVASSGSITELLNQVEYAQKVHTYDRNMLHEYEDTVQEVEDIKTGLEEKKTELESLQVEYEAQSQELNTTIEEKSDEIENLDGMIQEAVAAALEAERKRQEEEQRRQEEAAAQQQQQNQNQNTVTPSNPSYSGGGGGNDSYVEPPYSAVTGNAVVDRAWGCIGLPYVWGATGPGSFDCSGLVGYCLTGGYGRLGTTYTFMTWPQVSDPQPGDVCTNWDHCGIYIGGGQMIHAPQPGESVKVGPVQGGMIYVRY